MHTPPSSLLTAQEKEFAEAISRVNAANPFLPERIEAERAALGDAFRAEGAEWNTRSPAAEAHVNVITITARCGEILRQLQARWPRDGGVSEPEQKLYEDLAEYWLYHRYAIRFDESILPAISGKQPPQMEFYPAFRADVQRCFGLPGLHVGKTYSATHQFACAFQIRRAFHNIFQHLVGASKPMARLRGAIWQSICTHNLTRYRHSLYSRMNDFATLVTGPSGTGKELVARAIALSQYIPYDPKRGGFVQDFTQGFFPLNLAALSPTLIESELFGHRRGAFTGALTDRAGWMEVCPSAGAVFLDEIGEVDPGIQVKLLRVLQARTFQPLGSTEAKSFAGKIIAATHRDLPAEIRAGGFREDFYYRLCSDQITTPSLREQLDDAPQDLATMTRHVAHRLMIPGEAEPFVKEALRWMEKNLGAHYAWPGNFRELEQCVRNLALRGDYRPTGPLAAASEDDWNTIMQKGQLSADELLRRYAQGVYAQVGTVEETARRLKLDRRTVRARLVN